jgi:flagellar hook assembly protein FlgD
MGQEVMSLVNEYKPAGSHTIKWNGKDNNGNRLQTGMYLYKIKTDTGSKAGRIIFSK